MAVIALLAAGAAGAEERVRVALLPIVVHTAAADTDYLSAGLADMLSSRLERSGRVSVARVDGNAADRDEAVEAGRKAGVEYVIAASFTHFGEGASLDVQCLPVEGGPAEFGAVPRKVFIQSGSVGEIIPQLDGLADKITRYLDAGAPVAASNGSPAGGASAAGAQSAAEVDELRRRVEALERAVYTDPAAENAAAPESASEGVAGAQAATAVR